MSAKDEKSDSVSVTQPPYEPERVTRNRLLRKLDWHLLPTVSLLYLLAFLDRVNVGNAKIAGLTTDLRLTGLQFNLCSAMFFIPYSLLDLPCNMAIMYFRPSRWIPSIMFCWGVIMVSMGFVKNFAGLMVTRLFLGAREAGLYPGVSFYLCLWYPRDAQAQRLGIFISASSMSGAFGGLLAYAIERMDGIGGLAGWSWIVCDSLHSTIVIAIFAFVSMPDYPETAGFLTEEERRWLVRTIKQDTAGSSKALKRKFLSEALRDPHAYMFAAMNFFVVVPLVAFALFLPTIIVGLGYSSLHAQLLTIPPNICGLLATIIIGAVSDRVGMRGPFVLSGACATLMGYAILLGTERPVIGYIGTLLAASGIFPALTCVLAWTSGNAGGDIKRGAMIAILTGLGSLGAIASSFIYRAQDSPRYRPGHATNIGCCCMVVILSIVCMLEFARQNRAKRAECAREGVSPDDQSRFEEFAELGDKSPLYRCAEIRCKLLAMLYDFADTLSNMLNHMQQ
ncbi:MFS general substrate transporter [Wolfiporia cocos MD-104 SS10]|uniref:MFS general substrate transporter n=1 Tax=Wolfiporia cocos (strain MD-104) TaxID=742152 RepID=A0A2H3JW30_WOLCO|nr:MFS general substrate transporter [Wolfiporia cocos MD-104 SS10]